MSNTSEPKYFSGKFCIHCKWNPVGSNLCTSPGNGIDLVTGNINIVRCETNRYNYSIGKCREDAELFEVREKKVSTTEISLFGKIIKLFKSAKRDD